MGPQTQGTFSTLNMQEHADVCRKDARRLDVEECLNVVLSQRSATNQCLTFSAAASN